MFTFLGHGGDQWDRRRTICDGDLPENTSLLGNATVATSVDHHQVLGIRVDRNIMVTPKTTVGALDNAKAIGSRPRHESGRVGTTDLRHETSVETFRNLRREMEELRNENQRLIQDNDSMGARGKKISNQTKLSPILLTQKILKPHPKKRIQ